jgi:hypothetical protein
VPRLQSTSTARAGRFNHSTFGLLNKSDDGGTIRPGNVIKHNAETDSGERFHAYF